MNANELADELDKCWKYDGELFEKAAAMLRQQQAEIEALKAKLQLHEAMDKQCESLIRQIKKDDDDWKLTREYCS